MRIAVAPNHGLTDARKLRSIWRDGSDLEDDTVPFLVLPNLGPYRDAMDLQWEPPAMPGLDAPEQVLG